MLKAYKYRIYPDDVQKEQLSKFFGCSRFIYNLGLQTKIAVYASTKKTIGCFELMRQMTELKNTDAIWLQEVPTQMLQMSLRNLDNAYTRFFREKNGFPKFKGKYDKQSIQFPQKVKIKFDKNLIQIPKLKDVKCIYDRQFAGTIKTVTLSKTVTNKYFVSILVDNQKELPVKLPVTESTTVGIDMGIKDLAVLSNGAEVPNPKWFRNAQKNLRVQQRSLARKKKGSNRRGKQRLVVARVHEKIRNQRSDYLHKATTKIIQKYDTVVLEDLNIKGMMQNRRLSKAIGEIGWHEFKRQLQYKAEWYGKNIIEIGRFEPSSKICSTCGKINKNLQLSDRNWICECGSHHNRDRNAAINIKNIGLRNKALSS